MDFPLVDEKTQERFTRVYPLVSENEKLKATAAELGDPKMVEFRRVGNDPHWRLYESRIPAHVNPDEHFGKFVTPEAEAAFKRERDEYLAVRSAARERLSEEIPEEKRYYPTLANGNRSRFHALEEEHGATFRFNANVNAFVHLSGPTEPFAEFQTPEAKAAWEAQYKVSSRERSGVVRRAEQVTEATAARAAGQHFLADNMRGFLLPSKKNEAEREAQLTAMRQAPSEELAKVFNTTESELKLLERKQYGIQIREAQARGVSVEEFNKMDESHRRAAANFNGLSKQDFSRMVALKQGFFAMMEEMRERGLLKSRDQAREAKQREEKAERPKAVDEKNKSLSAEPPVKPEEQGKPKGRQSSKGAAAAAALASGLGR